MGGKPAGGVGLQVACSLLVARISLEQHHQSMKLLVLVAAFSGMHSDWNRTGSLKSVQRNWCSKALNFSWRCRSRLC